METLLGVTHVLMYRAKHLKWHIIQLQVADMQLQAEDPSCMMELQVA